MAAQDDRMEARWSYFQQVMESKPDARASIAGSEAYPEIRGSLILHRTAYGVLLCVQVFGLPGESDPCKNNIFAFHIHDGDACSGNEADPFAAAGTHYNPAGCDHPNHAGDLIPLFGNNGYAFACFLTNRFEIGEVIGKTVIIHRNVDDFTSQPAGNAGEKIACGKIVSSGEKRIDNENNL